MMRQSARSESDWRVHRDWRIHLSDPAKSLVFVRGEGGMYAYPKSVQAARAHVGESVSVVADGLAKKIRLHDRRAGAEAFTVTFEGVRFRADHIHDDWYALRNTAHFRPFKELHLNQSSRELLLAPSLNAGGLVVVCGDYGCGKTTTIASVVVERLRKFGGFAAMFSRPIEYDIGGMHGIPPTQGYCEQFDLMERSLDDAIRMSMRNFPASTPAMLGFPELFGRDGVGQLLQAANRGNLVFADVQAANPLGALLSLVSHAEAGGERYARDLLGNALRLMVHVRMRHYDHVDFDVIEVRGALQAALRDSEMPMARLREHLGDGLAGAGK